jgi:hypothetical protein
MKKISIFILLLIKLFLLQAQNPFLSHWYYSSGQHLSFQASPPFCKKEGSTLSVGATSTISDLCGNVMFYTSNGKVFNRLHQIMPNGKGLLQSETLRTVLIIPFPKSQTKYYVFTQYATSGSEYEIYYSAIDMSKDFGNGDVTSMNNLLCSGVEQGMTATYHSDGEHIWFITHPYDSPNYHAYLITANGITQPITSSYLGKHGGIFPKFSMQGNKMLVSTYSTTAIQTPGLVVMDFNKSTGILTYDTTIGDELNVMEYCFSPDESKVYVIDFGLLQIDLQSNETVMIKSGYFEGLQIASDDKIYISNGSSLHVINSPNSQGISCNFINLNIISGLGIGGISLFESKGNSINHNLLKLSIEHK